MSRLDSASLAFVVFAPAAWPQQGRPREEMYSAIVTGWAAGSKAVPFDFRITHFASKAKMNRYALAATFTRTELRGTEARREP